ncbi:hypothetical protein KDU71_01015 [Carboxylicivirga sediminis]|uniref:Uncharacterized protein n=1 Tax=Carboxylicivirga sediminis TaxID=2006564 RepID=A0A941F068_9BACT|nr:hypothetical protein [Carboxylicivirga sediminis]MBR8534127.1 hypothetical protein [Carboxylicivirga sediminis]
MKLLIAIAVAEYRERLQEFFSEHQVSYYNEIEMMGMRKLQKQHRLGNWFGQKSMGVDNIAFISFVGNEQADSLLENLLQCKAEMPHCNINAFVVDVEKGV